MQILHQPRLRRAVIAMSGVLATVGVVVVADANPGLASTSANPTISAGLTYTPLTLKNGWTNGPFGTRSAAVAKGADGIVHFKGAISSGTTNIPFKLPAAFRPASNVFVPVDLCNAVAGRLQIAPTGVVTIEVSTTFSDAQCFTSLEGASYAQP